MAGTIAQHRRSQRQVLSSVGIEIVDSATSPVAEDPALRPVLIPHVASRLVRHAGPFWLFPTGDLVATCRNTWILVSHPGKGVALKTLDEELRVRATQEAVFMTPLLLEKVVCEHVRVVCGSKRRMKMVDIDRITEQEFDRFLRACTRLVPQ